jgi:peptidoglycan hydrolase-like protein with peptidoglycan-binding domain
MSIGANPPLFHLGQTGYDYWNNYDPSFQQEFGLNIGTGNLTESPTVNSLLQFGNGLISYGAVPTAYSLSNGNEASVRQFGRASLAHNPGDSTSTQLSSTAQVITGQSNLPYLPY